MTLFKMVDGERVEMSPQEEAQIQAEWAADASAVVVPFQVTRRQAMAVLIKYGLDTQIAALLDNQLSQAQAGGDPAAILSARLAKNDWETSQEFLRAWPTLGSVSQALGWTSQYVDGLFIEAATL